ncbi:bifunctional adenosylcobinamide kinase/adenosylcobinamide-phosphate guanylyltransferase [Ideonella sp.]|uniref:bifunctional adenosylcobinamide kinase/adenosylcobinamide-phosphate guanylyltransferase n=1 Tax=Ideonella sp. TaxID=1929293 RepID=UPI003BB5957E
MKTLIIGGARSGKSALAESLAQATGLEVVVIVTAQALDAEMAARIAQHQAQRPAGWRTVEAPLDLTATLRAVDAPGRLLLVDCLTLWLSNHLAPQSVGQGEGDAAEWAPATEAAQAAVAELVACVAGLQAEVLLIGNEVGHGIVPLGPLSRVFVDENGRLHQRLAAVCERVRFVMAGCALALKG